MANQLAARLIREVRENLLAFERHPLLLAVRLMHMEDPHAVVHAMPAILVNEPAATRLIYCLHFGLNEITRFTTFNLRERVRELRRERELCRDCVKLAPRKH